MAASAFPSPPFPYAVVPFVAVVVCIPIRIDHL